MDSPQRDPNPTLSNLQESPFFKYLCSLSPIKTTKCVHVPQTYSEMTFPPPPTVFVSPPVSAHKGLSLLRSCILTNDQRNLVSETTVPAEITIEPETLENLWLNQNKTHLSGSPQEVQYEFCFVTDYCDWLIKTGDVNEESCICPSCRSSSNWYETKHIEQDLSEPFTEDLCGTDSEVTVKQTHVDDTLGQPIKVSTERSLVIKLVQGSSIESFDGSREAVSGKSKAETSAEGETVRMDDLRFSNEKHVENSGQKHKPTPVSEVPDEYMSRNDNLDVLEDLVLQELIDLAQEQSASTLPNGIITQSLEKSSEVLTSRLHDREIVNCVEKAATQLDVPEGDGRIKQDLSLHTYSLRQGRFSSGTGTSNRASGIGPRGFRRRCLDFEISEARRKNLGSKVPLSIHDTGNAFESTSFGRSKTPNVFPSFLCERTAATSDATNSEASNTDDHFVEDYQSEKIVASPGQDTPSCINDNVLVARKNNDAGKSPQDPASCRGSVSIPSGIGLHLNSLHTNMRSLMFSSSNSPLSRCSYAPLAKEINSGSYEGCIFSAGQDADFSVGSFPSSSPRLVVSLVENTKINQQAAMALSTSYLGVLSTSTCFQSIKVEQSQAEDVGVERNASSFENLMLQQDSFHQDFLEIAEDTSQSPHSPNRRGSRDKVGEGCKRCKCKKSRCLKLYCECFAAGVYCVDSCTCHECFNKPEYEETVLGTRQQIESRNPLAFAPKILRTAEPSPAEGEDLTSTPASGRHKRGCNCKKSLCLKKYCECYQAGVGCSEGCRCEGCKNIYGQKGVEDNEDKELHFDPGYKDFGLGTLEVIKQENTAHKTDQRCNKDLSPITPSFQLGWQGTSTAKPRHGKKRNSDQIGSSLYLPSASNLRKPSKLLTPPCNLSKSFQSHVSQATSDTETAGSPVSKMITTTMNELSPRWDGLDEICTLTPLLPHPSRPIPTSTSNTDKTAATLYLSGPEDSDQSLRSLAFRIGLSDGSSPAFRHPNTSSLSLQAIPNSSSMPATSLLLSTLCNATNKAINGEEGIDGNCLAMIGKDHVEDWIIDDGDATHKPFTTRSSPKQKRVTPPHCAGSKHRLGTAGSPAKRSPGLRKFILQALPPDKQQSHSWGPISTGPDEA